MNFPLEDRSSPRAHSIASSSDEELFHSAKACKLKQEICEIGRRMWMREYCDGNGGNISCRLAEDRFIVTPTGVSKGFMTPDMLCLVDGKGKQILAAPWVPSSEFLTHLAIYQSTPQAVSVCHAHPCHVGAFAIKQLEPPTRLVPEMELYVGQVPVARYETPGSPEIAASIAPFAPNHQAIILGLHGLICWGDSIEDAYFKIEITDAYCRTIILAQTLPGTAAIPREKMDDLLARKKKMGLPDNRFDLTSAEICLVDPWEYMGNSCACSPSEAFSDLSTHSAASPATLPNLEELVEKLTEKIVAKLKKGN